MPLILHNVPDDELYVGDDGVQRPYAMVFAQYVFDSDESQVFLISFSLY